MSKIAVRPQDGPPSGGPYTPGIIANGFIFVAGQVGILPGKDTAVFIEGGVQEQTAQALRNIEYILQTAGVGLENVVKTTVFLANMDDFAAMNAVYGTFFPDTPPARTTIQVAKLPLGALVEIEAVALAS